MAVCHDLIVQPQRRPLRGSVPCPPDGLIAQAALIVAALSEEQSELRGIGSTGEQEATLNTLAALGVAIEPLDKACSVRGASLFGLREPGAPLVCSSSRMLSLLAGVLAPQPFRTVLTGAPGLEPPNVNDLATALRKRGAVIEGTFASHPARTTLPLSIGPLPSEVALSETEEELGLSSADLKDALLLSGLSASGPTVVHERIVSPDHLSRLLFALGVPVATAGSIVELDPVDWPGKIPGFSMQVPGDPSFGVLLATAGTIVADSHVSARGMGQNPTRGGFFSLASSMGASIETVVRDVGLSEATGVLNAWAAPLRGISMGGETLVRARADLAALAVLAARAEGATELRLDGIHDAGSTTLLDGLATLLGAFGVSSQREPDALLVAGRPTGPLPAASVDAAFDGRLAAAGILLGLVADAPSMVRNADGLPERYPRLVGAIRALGGDVQVERRTE